MATTDEWGDTRYACGCIDYKWEGFHHCEKHMQMIRADDIAIAMSDGC